ncbi:PH domain-containing protein [Naasia aerilata]|uniref:Membrane protein n=1 Tax=Naasia aerilata TaxID=1162966 RepID=A0ABM8GAF1_9MICO|nr:PH domain-containing protein [Naasia aerilata]BDZ45188.1 membrane protein [Naasia aerilata]
MSTDPIRPLGAEAGPVGDPGGRPAGTEPEAIRAAEAPRAEAAALADGEWHRLHPATPFLRGGVAFVAILGILVANFRDRLIDLAVGFEEKDPFDLLIERGWLLPVLGGAIVLVLLGVVGFYLSWRFNQFRVTDEVVEVRSGILFRTQRQARLDRIQGINLGRPLLARLFGAARLEISVAGQDANVRLAFLGSAAADTLRRDVLALASGAKRGGAPAVERARTGLLEQRVGELLAPELDPGEAPPESVVKIPPGRLIGSLLLTESTLILVLVLGVGIPWSLSVGSWYVLLGAFPALLGMGSLIVQRFTRTLRYSIAGTPNGVRVGYGLLSTSNQTIPPGRVHAIAVRQPLLWRAAGWWQITTNLASSGSGSGRGGATPATTLLPVGSRADVARVLALLHPALGDADPSLLETGLVGKGGTDGFVNAPRRARWLRPFSWRRTGFTLTGSALVLRRGAIWRSLILVPQARLQSVALVQGPLQRRLRLAGVHAHTVAGPVLPRLEVVDARTAVSLFDDLRTTAVTSGEADTTHRWNSPRTAS